MHRPAEPTELAPVLAPSPRQAPTDAVPAMRAQIPYGREFWFAYLANTLLMVAVSLLFRYSDFIHILGGTELQLGWIVGMGAVGSLLMRMAQGVGIDHYGPRQIWLLSLGLVVATLLGHLLITRADGPAIYLVRTAYHTGLAGAFGASITYISLRAPVVRMVEMIGMLGSSGFVGMILGTQLGDFLCGAHALERSDVDRMFWAAAALATGSLVCAWLATRGSLRPIRRRRPPMLWLVRRYHPGKILAIGVMMGIGVGLPGTFLRPYTEALGITTIGTFFGVYSVTAFALRLATRRLPETIGIRPTILLGMGSLGISLLLYLPVRATWQLAFPGIAAGIAHALLFPSVVAGGSRGFPSRYRGLGTTLMLAMFDLGSLIGMPMCGSIVHVAERLGLPPYATLFVTIAALVGLTCGYFAKRR